MYTTINDISPPLNPGLVNGQVSPGKAIIIIFIKLFSKKQGESKMDKKFGYYIFGGTLIGALFGLFWVGRENPVLNIATGAFVGTAIGWFAAAYMMEKEKEKKQSQ